MGYKVLLPQPILESGRAYLLERGYELVDEGDSATWSRL